MKRVHNNSEIIMNCNGEPYYVVRTFDRFNFIHTLRLFNPLQRYPIGTIIPAFNILPRLSVTIDREGDSMVFYVGWLNFYYQLIAQKYIKITYKKVEEYPTWGEEIPSIIGKTRCFTGMKRKEINQ